MTLLFLTGKLTGSATGYCVVAVAEELAKRGHIVHIVSAYLKLKDRTECEGRLYIHEVPGHWIKRKIIQLQESGRSIDSFLSKVIILTQKVLIQIKGTFTIVPLFNDVKSLYYCASQLLDNNNVDVIIPVVNPRESIKVADLLFSKYKVPYVPYYLDSIYGNIGLRVLPGRLYKKMALRYENKWVKDAISIIMMQAAKASYDVVNKQIYKYVSKIEYLDLPLFVDIQTTNHLNRHHLFAGEFVILFIGSIPRRVRDPRYVFQLVDSVAKESIHFYFAGITDYFDELQILMKQNKNVHYLGIINHDQINDYINEADILLNIGNSIPGMLPSKIFEYMSYQKPIISTIKSPLDKSISYLNSYGYALILDEFKPLNYNVEEINRFIKQIHNQIIDINITYLKSPSGPFYYNTPSCFCDRIEDIISHNKN